MAKVQFFGGGGGTLPSGIAGAIQFSNVTTFNSDASNLFWDDANNRLGIGTNTPTANIHINHPSNNTFNLKVDRNGTPIFAIHNGGATDTHGFISYGSGIEVGRIGSINSGGFVSFQILGTMRNGPDFSNAGINFSTTGANAFGNPSFLFTNLSTNNYGTYADVIKPALIRLQGTHGASSGAGEYAAIRIQNTINQTGGTGINYGIIYEPTVTSITGVHYGLVIRPLGTLNGIGLESSLPTATWHVKGANDSTGSALYVQSQTNAKLIISNNDTHAINGAVSAADNLKITGNLGFTYSRSDSANWFKANSATYYGFDIKTSLARSANGYPLGIIRFSDGVPAFRFMTGSTYGLYFGGSDYQSQITTSGVEKDSYNGTVLRGFHVTSNESSEYNAGAVNLDVRGTAGSTSGKSRGVNMYITYSDNAFGNPYKAVNLKGTFNISSGTNAAVMFNIDPIYNQTGGTSPFTGIDYNPTLTALIGSHYGLRIRSGLNGFGVGAIAPVAFVHIGAGTDGIPQMKLETSAAPTGGALTDGTIWFDGTNLKMRIGGLTKTFTIV